MRLSKKEQKFYNRYATIKYGCISPNNNSYVNYGLKGIKIQENWLDYQEFKKDMYNSFLKHARKHGSTNTVLYRYDIKKDFTIDNIYWCTKHERAINKNKNKDYCASSPRRKKIKESFLKRLTNDLSKIFGNKKDKEDKEVEGIKLKLINKKELRQLKYARKIQLSKKKEQIKREKAMSFKEKILNDMNIDDIYLIKKDEWRKLYPSKGSTPSNILGKPMLQINKQIKVTQVLNGWAVKRIK